MKVQELVNLDYLNIQDVPQLKQIIQSYHSHIDIIIKQIHELSNIRDRNTAEGKTVVQKMTEMQQDNLSKTEQYKRKTDLALRNHQTYKNQLADDHTKTINNIELKHSQTISDLQEKIKGLKEKQGSMRNNEIEEIQFQAEIKKKSSSLITKQYDHHDNMNRQQEKELQQNKALFEKNKKMIKQLKRDVKMQAGRIVYQQKYENEDKNYDLKVKLFEVQEEVNKLRKERNEIVKTRNECKINASLNEQQIEEYKAVGSIQKSKIKIYNDKVESVKKTITSEISRLENKIKQKKSKWENELKGSKLKLLNFEKEKEELKVGLEKYRILGETILMQRQQVEEFFLMAIEACKREMGESGPTFDASDKQYGEKVDIDELLPKDKHRIITNLYTKLALAPTK